MHFPRFALAADINLKLLYLLLYQHTSRPATHMLYATKKTYYVFFYTVYT